MAFPREVENLIAALRGLPEDCSQSKLRPSRSIAELLPEALRKCVPACSSVSEIIETNWRRIVGPANAAYSHLLHVDGGRRVFIGVSNSIVRQEMSFHRKLILDRIRAIPGCAGVREIMLRAG